MALVAPTQVAPVPSSIGVVADEFDLSTITTGDLVFAGAAVVTAILISQITKRAMRRVLDDLDGVPVMAGNVIARIVSYIILTMGLVVALEALGFSSGLVGSMLLLVIIVVVFAAKPLLQDLGAGLIIQLRRPFGVGDLVAIGAVEGEVEEVSARTVRLITVDGRRVHLPNRSVLDGAITNLTNEGRRLTTFIVGAAYDTDLDLARQVIVEALDSSPLVLSDPPPQAFVEDFADSTINIACRFWHQPQVQAEWAARDESMRAVKRALDDAGITIAFPQRVLWVQPTED